MSPLHQLSTPRTTMSASFAPGGSSTGEVMLMSMATLSAASVQLSQATKSFISVERLNQVMVDPEVKKLPLSPVEFAFAW